MTDADHVLTDADKRRVLEAVAGTDAVLVGGQAISVWVDYYGHGRIPELATLAQVFVSRDMDFAGGREEALHCAAELAGELNEPAPEAVFEAAPINAAIVTFVGERGDRHRVDFLANVFGVHDVRELVERAVPLETDLGTVRIVDPVTQVVTRIANLVHLRRGQAAALTQAQLAVWIAREWIVDVMQLYGHRSALRVVERLFRHASTANATAAAVEYGVEVFDGIQPLEGLPASFIERRYPQMKELVARKRR